MPQTRTFGIRGPGHDRIRYWPLAASQTGIKTGDYLTVDSSTNAIQGAAAGSRVGAISTLQGLILGRALEDATDSGGTAKTFISYEAAMPGIEFELPLYSATPSLAYPKPASQIRTAGFELINVNSNGGWYAVDLDHTSNIKLKIVDFNPEYLSTWPGAITDGSSTTASQYGSVWVEFTATACFHTAVGS